MVMSLKGSNRDDEGRNDFTRDTNFHVMRYSALRRFHWRILIQQISGRSFSHILELHLHKTGEQVMQKVRAIYRRETSVGTRILIKHILMRKSVISIVAITPVSHMIALDNSFPG